MSTFTPPDWRARAANQTRLAYGQALLELGARDPKTVVVSADTQDLLGIRPYIERFRDRFVEMGIAEQNAIGAASGMATTGLHPFVCAYAPFITARSMEQVRNDVAYAHQRSFPNMTVIVPADADEAYQATVATLDIDGPVYMRLGGRVEEPPVNPADYVFRLGKAVQVRDGNDLAIIACGAMVQPAAKASDTLREQGIKVRVINMSSIKPLDRDAILAAAEQTRGIVTAEEHHLTGGLGGAVAELLALERPTRMRMIGMPDAFASVGPTPKVREKYGMSAPAIVEACRSLLG